MADQKITQLTELTTVASEDLLAVVDDPSGTPMTKKATISNLVGGLKATGAEVDTGTEDAKIVTPKAIADSKLSYTDGAETLSNKTLTAPQINDTTADHQYIFGVSELTADRTVTLPLLTGNDEFTFNAHAQTLTNKTLSTGSKLDANADSNFTYNSLYRQAIINGNFDVWQRGTSFTSIANAAFSADRFSYFITGSSNNASRGTFTLGQTDVPNFPRYYLTNAVTTSAGASNRVAMVYKCEDLTKFAGKTFTLSFWAKADASKNIAVEFLEFFGTGGSPSATVTGIEVTKLSLTTAWAKQTITVDVPSISGKTIGTDNNSSFQIIFWFDAGSDYNARTSSLGQQSGTFDIAQVQLCAGDVALPFMPKSYEEELRACQRYCLAVTTVGVNEAIGFGTPSSATVAYIHIPTKNTLRVAPTLVATAGDWRLLDTVVGGIDVTSLDIDDIVFTSGNYVVLKAGTAGSLTAGRPAFLAGDGNAGRVLILSSEL